MNEKVSRSATGQHLPMPTREERDAAFSTGAGRRAIEIPKEEDLQEDACGEGDDDEVTCAPVGTELETQAREVDDPD